MTRSNFATSVPSNNHPANKEILGRAAETAGDLAIEGNGKDILQPRSRGNLNEESNNNKKAESGAPTLDPICNMEVDQSNAFHVERDGKIFYFCSENCRRLFLETIAEIKSEN